MECLVEWVRTTKQHGGTSRGNEDALISEGKPFGTFCDARSMLQHMCPRFTTTALDHYLTRGFTVVYVSKTSLNCTLEICMQHSIHKSK